MLRQAFATLGRAAPRTLLAGLRGALGGVRFRFSIPIDGRTTAEFAMSRLNRKLQRAGVMKKLRTRNRGFVKQSRIKYDARLKRAYKLSYRRVQSVLTWIEMERMFSAKARRERRIEKGRKLPEDDAGA
mmetsp:Transcript_7174/g.22630  ORF Transcript_7174/g.22630 Transcript_7174/m.22630 type:complete len:129 (+) Transcript_7174:1012-1398(+)